ncbi:hypothetical protein Clacol_007175 [Clathrus columnatus]|uniref:Uncharacterized protein n=1 Tax=Clathrus columnatus TaxID=1419009 RepID=A0AAV5AJR2_9AGAM|nr:hypothetical protein Clacol_007175 [Clathrus columnatus]
MTDTNTHAPLNFARKIHVDIATRPEGSTSSPTTRAVPVPVWIPTSTPPLNRVPRVRRASHQIFSGGIPLRIRDIEIELQQKINAKGLDLKTMGEVSQRITQFLQNTGQTLEEYPSLDIINKMLKQLSIAQQYVTEQQKFEQDMKRSLERRRRYFNQLITGRPPVNDSDLSRVPLVTPSESNEHENNWFYLTETLQTQRR